MIKNILFTLQLILLFWTKSAGQSKIEKYCEIEAYHKTGFSTKISIRFINGEVDSLFSFADTAIKSNLDRVKQFNTIPDALNYLAPLGWKLISVTTVYRGEPSNFYFKREFDKSELAK